MNQEILDKYGIKMERTSIPFDANIEGYLETYLFVFRHPEDVQDFIDDVNLALSGRFDEIQDTDYSASLFPEPDWLADITPTHFEIRHISEKLSSKQRISLDDWKEILISWKYCLE